MAIHIRAYITEDGEIKAELPANHPIGAVNMIIETSDENVDAPLTDEEMREYLTFRNKPLGEIEIGGWENLGITNSLEFVEEIRHQEQERRGNWTLS